MSVDNDFTYLTDMDETFRLPDTDDNPAESIERLEIILKKNLHCDEVREVALALLKHVSLYTGL